MSITLQQAQAMIAAAHTKAESIGIKVIGAVVDASGHLIALSRMDGAPWGSIDVAINKAYTAAAWGASTAAIADECRPTGSLHSIHFSNHGKLITFGGGEPLYIQGQLAGALGVSGGTVEEDVECALTGISVL